MRAFVAIEIGEETRAELARVRAVLEPVLASAAHPPRVTWVDPAHAHVTLEFIGEIDEAEAAAVKEALGTPFTQRAFDVTWDGVGAFGSARAPRVIWLGCAAGADQLISLARAVDDRLKPVLGRSDDRPFRPHLTLARVREPGRGVPWSRVIEDAAPRPTSGRVHEVVLFQSRLSPKGPSYTALQRTSLA